MISSFSRLALRLAGGLACAAGLASAVQAQADLTKAARVACTPDSVTRCEAADKCTTRPASTRDKSELLVLDFGAKTASVRQGSESKKFADLVDETVDSGERKFALAEGGKANGMKLAGSLTKDGKLTLSIDRQGSKAQATCVAS